MIKSSIIDIENVTIDLLQRAWRHIWEGPKARSWSKNKTMGGPAKVECSEWVSSLQPGPDPHANFARGHLSQSNGDEAHQTDGRVVTLDEDECTRRDISNEVLRAGNYIRVRVVVQTRGVIRPGYEIRLRDNPVYGRVPAVIVERA